MEKKVRKNKELTVGVALVSLFVGIAVFVPKVLNTEAVSYTHLTLPTIPDV